jgi:hypothetical protein
MNPIKNFRKLSPVKRGILIAIAIFVVGLSLGASAYAVTNNFSRDESVAEVDKQEDNDDSITKDLYPESVAGVFDSQEGEQTSSSNQSPIPAESTPQSTNTTSSATTGYRQFTGQQFVDYYNSFVYSNVTSITIKPSITGDEAVDSYIQGLAEDRGYRLRGESLTGTNQPQLTSALKQLQSAASQEAGLNFVLVSGYRSIGDQRGIFLREMDNFGVNRSAITSGSEDQKLENILVTRSVPGYSKHHTGYTVDFGCNGSDLLGFKLSSCFSWISANNYYNAKRFGLIPSYPDGAKYQGPDPEEWEYVWVGENNLR